MIKKICATCGKLKDSDDFYRDINKLDGLRNTCKQCSVQNKNYNTNVGMIHEKICNTCTKIKPLEQFIKDDRRTLGYGMVCLQCSQLKLCRTCQKKKSIEAFGRTQRSADGYRYKCKECENAKKREKYANDPSFRKRIAEYQHTKNSRDGRRERMLIQKYGLTLDDYQAMLESQNYCCKICDFKEGERGRSKLAVDHDKDSGKVRGLLCDPCNRAIGMLLHDVNILENAKKYLMAAHFG